MKNKWWFLTLTVCCLLSFYSIADSFRSRAQSNLRPDYQLLVHSLRGNTDAVRELLSNGVDPNTPPGPNDKGMTALMFAAWKGNSEIVNLLVNAGADINAVSNTGATALIYAANGGHEEIVGTLLARGARTDIQMKDGATALFYALRAKDPQLISLIANQSPPGSVNHKRQNGDNVLLAAVKMNDLNLIDAVLNFNPALEEKDKYGQTALMYSARKGNTRAVIRLLNKGADPNARDEKRITARTKAKIGKHRAVDQVLRAKGGKG